MGPLARLLHPGPPVAGYRRTDPSYRGYCIAVALPPVLIVLLLSLPLVNGAAIRVEIFFGASLAYLVISFVYVNLMWTSFQYLIGDNAVTIRKGILFHHRVVLMFDEIKEVKITSGPLQRAFGLCTIHFQLQGGQTGDYYLPGLREDKRMVDRLIDAIDNAQNRLEQVRNVELRHIASLLERVTGAPPPPETAPATAPPPGTAPVANPPSGETDLHVNCPKCRAALVIYAPERPLTFSCPACGTLEVLK